jgi:hypothetical protein
MIAFITLGALAAYILLAVAVVALIVALVVVPDSGRAAWSAGALGLFVVFLVVWWWGMAFTFSGDYHAWNVKEGTVTAVNKRIVSTGENKISERYVLRFEDGNQYGVDDTRASLVQRGDVVRLKCKKDYEWGIPRESHGWACRWLGAS